jgi:hypothetical protein
MSEAIHALCGKHRATIFLPSPYSNLYTSIHFFSMCIYFYPTFNFQSPTFCTFLPSSVLRHPPIHFLFPVIYFINLYFLIQSLLHLIISFLRQTILSFFFSFYFSSFIFSLFFLVMLSEQLKKATTSLVVSNRQSARPSPWNNATPTRQVFVMFGIVTKIFKHTPILIKMGQK